MGARIIGKERLRAKLLALPNHLSQPIKQAVLIGAVTVENDAKASIRQPGKGRIYRRGTRTHQASAPGDPPASDTGRLLGSVETVVVDQGFAAEVGSGVEYAAMLEFGTTKMAARPWLFPAFERNRRGITEGIAAAVKRALRGVGRP